MNANELADELEDCEPYIANDFYLFKAAANMLRQQQAEIEALKLGNIQWSHAFDMANIEIADLKDEIEALKESLNKHAMLCADLAKRYLNVDNSHPVKEQLTDEDSVTLMKVAQILLEKFGDLTAERIATLRKAEK